MTTPAASSPPTRTRLAMLLVVQFAVVLVCVLVTTVIAIAVQERSIRSATAERVLDVSESLAGLAQVKSAVQGDRDAAMRELQPLADLIEEAAGVDYVVVTDAAGIRLTHPTPSERGLPVSTDPSEVLAGETFVGTEIGTLGPTLRAKVPVVDGSTIVGTASVGILESDISTAFDAAVRGLLPWVVGSLVVGFGLSGVITAFVGRRLRRLERGVRELETQRLIAAALRDQTHEFHTRLHVIRGLVADGETTEALEYIGGIVPVDSSGGPSADGHGVFSPRLLSLDDPALRALLDGLSADATARGVRLDVDPASSAPRGILDDGDFSVIANLCRNALEAVSPEGRVQVFVGADEHGIVIDVSDDGPGIEPSDLARIFQRGVSSKSGGDRGVGLDLVRRHVRARSGDVTVGTSDLGGARFTVEMPAPGVRR
ncbi:ATP-binding protein [Microbacterium sp. SLBN-146]|uniref:sensor histidine kinase n=1 Tax=Microbacterium sp. SLBN-146 TaxID=2768457 RepID=UPI00116E59FA|nr:ATP-binding protein [Microbacterium sp. SLBN-146]TQJ31296.1 histidine kinase/DNA gyrase B/HSP90-like ATPase [Microbacterium sp. SLBN-146]